MPFENLEFPGKALVGRHATPFARSPRSKGHNPGQTPGTQSQCPRGRHSQCYIGVEEGAGIPGPTGGLPT